MQKVRAAVTVIVQMTANIETTTPTINKTPKEMSHFHNRYCHIILHILSSLTLPPAGRVGAVAVVGLLVGEGVFDMTLLAVFLLVVVPTTEEVTTQIQRHSAMNL